MATAAPSCCEAKVSPAGQTTRAGLLERSQPAWFATVGFIAALSLALRCWHLGYKSLWLDEGVSIWLARMSWPEFFKALWIREANMSLYYLLLRVWRLEGESEIWLRLPGVLLGVASIVATMLLAERLANRRVAAIAGFLIACNTLHIRYSREVRSYGLLCFLLVVSWICAERIVHRGKRKDWIGWTLVSVLAIYAHMFAALVAFAQVVALLLTLQTRHQWKTLARCIAIWLIASAPFLVVALRSDGTPLNWVPPLSFSSAKTALIGLCGGPPWIAAIYCAGFVIAIARTIQRPRDSAAADRFLMLLGAAIPIVALALLSLKQPAFIDRYLILALPMLSIAVAEGISALPVLTPSVVAVAVIALSIPQWKAFFSEPAWTDFRSASQYISTRARPGDVAVLWGPLSRGVFDYYGRRLDWHGPRPQVVFPASEGANALVDNPTLEQLDELSRRHDRIWVVFETTARPEQFTIWNRFIMRRTGMQHRIVSRADYFAVSVYEFER